MKETFTCHSFAKAARGFESSVFSRQSLVHSLRSLVCLIAVLSLVFLPVTPALAADLYFNGNTDSDWNTLANWFEDAAYTTPASELPTELTNVYINANVESIGGGSGSVSVASAYFDNNMHWDTNYAGLTLTVGGGSGMATFNGSSISRGTIDGNATFNEDSWNQDGTITGDAVIAGTWYNGTVQTGKILKLNSGGGWGVTGTWYGNVGGTVYDSTGRVAITEYNFFDSCDNSYNGLSGNAVFYSNSYNRGPVSGNAIFNETSANLIDYGMGSVDTGTIDGTAFFDATVDPAEYGNYGNSGGVPYVFQGSAAFLDGGDDVRFIVGSPGDEDAWTSDTSGWVYEDGDLSWKFSNSSYLDGGTLTGSVEFDLADPNAGDQTGVINAGALGTVSGDFRTDSGITIQSGIVSSNINGDGGLTKSGAGLTTLTGANTYTGATNVAAGILNIQNNEALGNSSGVSVTSGAALEIEGGIATTSATPLTLNGTGVGSNGALRNISGDNDYTGLVTLGSDGVRISADAGSSLMLSNLGTITGSGFDLTIGGGGSVSIYSVIDTDGGSLLYDGTGNLGLENNNSYEGGTTINAGGTVTLGAEQGISSVGLVTINGILNLNGYAPDYASLAGSGRIKGNSGSNILTIGSDDTSRTFSGVIEDDGDVDTHLAFEKVGAGTLTLSGANTYTGGTTISNGTLQIGAGGLTGSVAGNITNDAALIFNRSNNLTYSGVVSGGGTLTQSGAGSLTLSNTHTYTGATSVNTGTLVVDGSIAASSLTTVQTAGTLSGSGTTGDLTIGSGGTLAPGASPGTLTSDGDVTYAAGGTYVWEIDSVVVDPGTHQDFHSIDGDLTIAPDFIFDITSLTGAGAPGDVSDFNRYANYEWNLAAVTGTITSTTFTIADHFTNATTCSGAGCTAGVFSINVDGTDLVLSYSAAVNTPPHPIYWQGDTSGAWNLHAGDGTTNWVTDDPWVEANAVPNSLSDVHFYHTSLGQTLATTLGQDFTIQSLTMDAGTSAVSVSGNTLTLNSSGNAITMIAGAGALTINSDVVLGGAQSWTNNDTTNDLTVAGAVNNAGNLLTVTGNGDTDISGAISGAGGLTKTGTGTLALSGANTYSGTTTLSAGTLQIGVASVGGVGAITSSAVGTGTLALNGGTLSSDSATARTLYNAVTLGGDVILGNAVNTGALTFAGAGTLTGTRTLTTASDVIYSGAIGQSAPGYGLTKAGADTLTLSGTNTYTGLTTVNEGTLKLSGGSAIADAGAVTVSGGTLNVDDAETVGAVTLSSGTISGDSALTSVADIDAREGAITAALDGAAGLTKTTSGTVVLGGTNTYTGATTITEGALQLDGSTAAGSTVGIGTAGTLTGSGTVNGNATLTGSGVINKSAGTIAGTLGVTGGFWNGAGSVTGAVTSSSGVFTVGNGANLTVAGGLNVTGGSIASGNGSSTITGSVNYMSASSSTFNGVIAGAGKTLTMNNADATLTLGGDNIYTGGTTINAGTVQVSNAGALGTGAVVNNGSLSIGLVGLNLGDDYTQGAGAALNLTADSASSYGKVVATGNASVANTSVFNITVSGYMANGTVLDLIEGATGTFNDPATYTINVLGDTKYTFSVAASGGKLSFTANRASEGFASDAGGNSNSAAVGGVLDNIPGATGDMLNVLNTLDGMSPGAVGNALGTMTPDVSSGTAEGSRAMTGNSFSMISNRLGGARNGGTTNSGVSSGEVTEGLGVWMQGLGSHMKQKERKGIEGFTANTWGTTIGIDKLIDRHFRAGLAGSYGWSRVKAKTPGNPSDDINSYQATLYGSYDSLDLCKARQGGLKSYEAVRSQVEDSWYVDGMLAFTQNNYDSRREIWLGSGKRVAKADHYGQQYSTNFETGYKFAIGTVLPGRTVPERALEVTPFASLGYNYLYMNSYKEKGADALNLSVRGEGFHQLEQTLGMKLAYPIVAKKVGTFIPSAKAAWLYDYIGDRFETTANFAGGGASFNTVGAKPAKSGMLLGAELAFLNKGNITVTGNWDIELKDEFMSNTYYGTVRYDF